MPNLPDLMRDVGPLLVRWAGFLIVVCASPLLALAWWKRIYPNTPLVVLLGVPCALSVALLVQGGLLPLIAVIDLLTLPRRRAFSVERETTRVVSVQKSHPVTLHISNLSQQSIVAWIRD